ncbi:GNAT family N-acetyltransferase [Neorhizobium alkalisoli]|uniref:GNAT family N-acetyltransferase n=1 Tax=Neorhizobium alkalisoli TaxID=528178 RepID=UPI001FDF8686|nr:GNAT family N-acetyltransferase [Neorhizobium alkalisoli]
MDIRFFELDDTEELASLFEEMQTYYGVFCPPRETILAGLLGRPPETEILVVATDRIVAFAAFAAIYPGPGLKPGFFLKELYVSASERGREIGTTLMKRIATLAVERGFGRIDWTAARANDRLLSFYDGLGADRKEDRIFYRLEGENLVALAGQA